MLVFEYCGSKLRAMLPSPMVRLTAVLQPPALPQVLSVNLLMGMLQVMLNEVATECIDGILIWLKKQSGRAGHHSPRSTPESDKAQFHVWSDALAHSLDLNGDPAGYTQAAHAANVYLILNKFHY